MIRVTPKNLPTQELGITLDGVWVSASIKVTKAKLKDGIREITDHIMIELSLILDSNVSRSLPRKVKKFTT